MRSRKFDFIKKTALLSVSAVMFCKQFLAYVIGVIMLSINIQVGLNMHLYDDIGDALSSLRGSTSSFILWVQLLSNLLSIWSL